MLLCQAIWFKCDWDNELSYLVSNSTKKNEVLLLIQKNPYH